MRLNHDRNRADLDTRNARWVLARRPVGLVSESDFRLEEVPVPELVDGQFLVKVIFLSLAPVMAQYVLDGGVIEKPVGLGEIMRGRGVGVVMSSRHPGFTAGDVVHGPFGWQKFAISDGKGLVFKMRDWAGSISNGLGALGLTGFTAYFGLFDVGSVRAGDTVLVSGAVGGVGSVAGQLARIAGADPVAIAGSPAKCAIAVESLGYRAAIDYKTEDVRARVAALAPQGVDVYFDNVGGDILEAAIDNMAQEGRIVVCGSISQYLTGESKKGPANYFNIVYRNVRMQGFHIYSYASRFTEAEARLARWIRDGRLQPREDRIHGLENMPAALQRLFASSNTGKQVVQIADDVAS
ncbi:MAG: NADP-dependent oxidoreductase [Nevskiaceae bacterium]